MSKEGQPSNQRSEQQQDRRTITEKSRKIEEFLLLTMRKFAPGKRPTVDVANNILGHLSLFYDENIGPLSRYLPSSRRHQLEETTTNLLWSLDMFLSLINPDTKTSAEALAQLRRVIYEEMEALSKSISGIIEYIKIGND